MTGNVLLTRLWRGRPGPSPIPARPPQPRGALGECSTCCQCSGRLSRSGGCNPAGGELRQGFRLDLWRDLDPAHLGGEAARPLPLALLAINRDLELEPLERAESLPLCDVTVSAPVRLRLSLCRAPFLWGSARRHRALPPRPRFIAAPGRTAGTANGVAFVAVAHAATARTAPGKASSRHGRKRIGNGLGRAPSHPVPSLDPAGTALPSRCSLRAHQPSSCPLSSSSPLSVYAEASVPSRMNLQGSAVGTLRPGRGGARLLEPR